MLAGVIAAFGFAIGVLIDKFALSRRRIAIRELVPALFLLLALLTALAVSVVPDHRFLYAAMFSPSNITAFLVMVALAVTWNILYFRALAKETVQEFDLILMLEPLATIFLASVFLQAERNWVIIAISFVAALALVYAHLKRQHIVFDTYARGLILAVILMGLEVLVLSLLLRTYTPLTLYFWRTLAVFLATTALYRPRFSRLKAGDLGIVLITAVFGVIQMVARYYGYAGSGVILTTLALLLGPLMVEIASVLLLKEKIKPKSTLAFAVILLCVVYANMLTNH